MTNSPLISRLTPEALAALPGDRVATLRYLWPAWARPDQIAPPGDWVTWLIMTGRGWGKNRTAGEWIRQGVYDGVRLFALVGREPSMVRNQMIEHPESGILRLFPPHERPHYEPSKRTVTFHTGAVAHCYSAENPDQFRGGAYERVWYDEFASFRDWTIYDEIQMGLRIAGTKPQQVVTTTPKPVRRMRDLMAMVSTIVTSGTSYDNRANLSPDWYERVIAPYVGTARGQQEIMGMLLDSLPGALWTREMIRYREPPNTTRRVIGVDPSLGDGETSDECGIVGVGLAEDGNLDVLGDWSVRASPLKWARRVVRAYYEIEADYIVIERNAGGKALLKMNLDQVEPGLPVRDVWAKEAKEQRASNPALKYELGQVYHAKPMPEMEDQMCTWIPGEGPSPDRLDALVWAIRSLTTPQFAMKIEVL